MNKTDGKRSMSETMEIFITGSKKTATSLARIIFPTDIYCICCGSIIDSSRTYSLCDSCIEKFQWIGSDTCDKCGKPLGKDDPHDLCWDCRNMTRYFDKGYTCCLYDLYARAVIMDLKYRDKSYLGRIIGDILADRMEVELSDVPEVLSDNQQKEGVERSSKKNKKYDLVIPVPVSPERMETRGYNQAALIAARFAERTGLPMSEDSLVREDRKKAMKDLNAMQRRLNVRGVFSLTEQGRTLIESFAKRILIIDDIYTTGSTVDECARVLKEAGAARVDVLTFAAGRNYTPQT